MFISNANLVNTRHESLPFTGKWAESLGTPSPTGMWMVYGTSGSGKTTFCLQLAKYLSEFRTVLYWSLEQGNTRAFQSAWMRCGMQACGGRVIVADDGEEWDTIEAAMLRRRGREVLIVDSLTPLKAMRFGIQQCVALRKRLAGKLIVFVGHERDGLPDTTVGDYILKMADLKMRVEGYTAFVNDRSGQAHRDFVIWPEGAQDYWANAL